MISKFLGAITLSVVFASGALPAACEHKIGEDDNTPTPTASAQSAIQPLAIPTFSATPLSAFLDAGDDTLDKAKQYEANGQLWLARLLIEPRALADDAKPDDLKMLARICDKQEDDACLVECNRRLPKNMQIPIYKRDGGRAAGISSGAPMPSNALTVVSDNSDFAKAQKLLLANKLRDARAILEPKLLNNTASPEEIRLLREVCKSQNDKMCVALCSSKLN